MEKSLILAIDQGTSSSRVIIFDSSNWNVVTSHQVEFDSIYPEEGWCEQDPKLLLDTVKEVRQKNTTFPSAVCLQFSKSK